MKRRVWEATTPETPLQQAERHIREGEVRIERQSELLAKLIRGGRPEAAVLAGDLLHAMGKSLELFREHLRLKRCGSVRSRRDEFIPESEGKAASSRGKLARS